MGRGEDGPRGTPPIAGIFDCCYVLNCDQDAARLQRIARRLTRLQIPFTRFPAALPPSDLPQYQRSDLRAGHWACGLSHILLLREVHKSGFPCALILEDDAILRDDALEQLAVHRQQIESAAWDVLYIGCHAMRDLPDQHPPLIGVLSAFHTHAYAVRRAAIPALIAAIGQRLGMMDGPFDEFRWPGLRKVRFSPTPAIQEPGFSHTTGAIKDRTRQYFPRAADQAEFRAHCREFADLTRLAVATLWTDAIADLAAVTLPSKRDYCSAWSLPYIERHGRIHKDRPAAWSKLPLLIAELPRHDWIFWTDADALFMRRDVDLRGFLDDDYDLIWTEDESGPNTGNFFIRNTPAALDLLGKADALFGQTTPEDRRGRFRGQWEQAAIREVIEAGNAPGLRVKVIPKRAINSYDTDYEPGDFILHLPGLLKLDRLAKFGDFKPDRTIFQSIPEIKTACQLRRNLWLGGEERAKDADWLRAQGITAILNVAKECADPDCGVARFSEPLEDVEGNTPAMIEGAKATLCRLLDAGEMVYLHCVWGLNRSVYIATHVLASREGRTFEDAFVEVRSIRGPNASDKLRKLYG